MSGSGRYVLKPVWEHASVGIDDGAIIHVKGNTELCQALRARQDQLNTECFAEAYVEGREFNISLLATPDGPQMLPPAEMRFDGYPASKWKVVDYRAKWDEGSFEYQHTIRTFAFSPQDSPLLGRLVDLAGQCWELFGLRGYARVDFRVDQGSVPWVLEINANPCLSPDAGFMAAAMEAGLSMKDVAARIIEDAQVPRSHPNALPRPSLPGTIAPV